MMWGYTITRQVVNHELWLVATRLDGDGHPLMAKNLKLLLGAVRISDIGARLIKRYERRRKAAAAS